MRVLVLGGTGTVGSAVSRQLVERGVETTVLTRSAEKASRLPAGASAVVGDLLDPASVRSVVRGVDGVFLLNAVSVTECHEGLMALNAAREARVSRIVYVSVASAEQAVHLPHFGSKVAIEMALKASGLDVTILRPNNFFQNDYWLREAIVSYGLYPQPIGASGIARVDVRDVADAAVAALTTDGHAGETYALHGPANWTGDSTARAWSEALGRPVRYAGDDLDAWEQQAVTMLPPWMAYDFRMMYAYFQEHGLAATPSDMARAESLMGHAPRRFEDFAAETAAAWTQAPAAPRVDSESGTRNA
ncbi:MAG: NmrA family NAD(P)-binding protein [Vicinamibacteraceae bacterium]|nr:NmrA family NAD(P)-binding protein [Vicinamibacteraceae bacterium]